MPKPVGNYPTATPAPRPETSANLADSETTASSSLVTSGQSSVANSSLLLLSYLPPAPMPPAPTTLLLSCPMTALETQEPPTAAKEARLGGADSTHLTRLGALLGTRPILNPKRITKGIAALLATAALLGTGIGLAVRFLGDHNSPPASDAGSSSGSAPGNSKSPSITASPTLWSGYAGAPQLAPSAAPAASPAPDFVDLPLQGEFPWLPPCNTTAPRNSTGSVDFAVKDAPLAMNYSASLSPPDGSNPYFEMYPPTARDVAAICSLYQAGTKLCEDKSLNDMMGLISLVVTRQPQLIVDNLVPANISQTSQDGSRSLAGLVAYLGNTSAGTGAIARSGMPITADFGPKLWPLSLLLAIAAEAGGAAPTAQLQAQLQALAEQSCTWTPGARSNLVSWNLTDALTCTDNPPVRCQTEEFVAMLRLAGSIAYNSPQAQADFLKKLAPGQLQVFPRIDSQAFALMQSGAHFSLLGKYDTQDKPWADSVVIGAKGDKVLIEPLAQSHKNASSRQVLSKEELLSGNYFMQVLALNCAKKGKH